MAIVGVIATLAMPRYRSYVARARQGEAQINLAEIRNLQKSYSYEYGGAFFSGLHYGLDKCDRTPTEENNLLGFRLSDCSKSRYRYITNAGNDCAKSDGNIDQGQVYPGCRADDEWHISNTGKLTHTQDVISKCPHGGGSPSSSCVAVALPSLPSPTPASPPISPPTPSPPSPPSPSTPPAPAPPSTPSPAPPLTPAPPVPPSPPAPAPVPPPTPPSPSTPSPPEPPPACNICTCNGKYVIKGYDSHNNVSCSLSSTYSPNMCDSSLSLSSLPSCTQSMVNSNCQNAYWYNLPCAPDSTTAQCSCASRTIGNLCVSSSIPPLPDTKAVNSMCSCPTITFVATDTNSDGSIDSNEIFNQVEKPCRTQTSYSGSYECPQYFNPKPNTTIVSCQWQPSTNLKLSLGNCGCEVVFKPLP